MRFHIAQRWQPYSHAFGSRCLIPGTTICAEIYPTRLRLFDLSNASGALLAEMPLNLAAPLKQFTVCQDLEKGHVNVWGHSQQGFFLYRLHAALNGGINFTVKKSPPHMAPAEAFFGKANLPVTPPTSFENLSFGLTKAQDWTFIHRRLQLGEILPLWFRLGQWVPTLPLNTKVCGGTFALLPCIEALLSQRSSKALALEFQRLYCAGFEGMLVPRTEDTEFQGFGLPALASDSTSPLILLSEGRRLIKRMLVDIEDDQVHLLPTLLPELHAGRGIDFSLGAFGKLDLEWSKKSLRRMRFLPTADCSLAFKFYKGLGSCRLRQGAALAARYQNGERFDFFAAKDYVFDNFQ